jgi:hypothetical protein
VRAENVAIIGLSVALILSLLANVNYSRRIDVMHQQLVELVHQRDAPQHKSDGF